MNANLDLFLFAPADRRHILGLNLNTKFRIIADNSGHQAIEINCRRYEESDNQNVMVAATHATELDIIIFQEELFTFQ